MFLESLLSWLSPKKIVTKVRRLKKIATKSRHIPKWLNQSAKVNIYKAVINEDLELVIKYVIPPIMSINKTNVIFINSDGNLVDEPLYGYCMIYENSILKNNIFVYVQEDEIYEDTAELPQRVLLYIDGLMAVAQGIDVQYETNEHARCLDIKEETATGLFLIEPNGTLAIKFKIILDNIEKTETKIIFINDSQLFMSSIEGYEAYTNYRMLRNVLPAPKLL